MNLLIFIIACLLALWFVAFIRAAADFLRFWWKEERWNAVVGILCLTTGLPWLIWQIATR